MTPSRPILPEYQGHGKRSESALDGALAKTKTPHATYLASTPLERRLLNQTFFKRILVGEEGTIDSAELTPVYSALSAWEPSLGAPKPKTGQLAVEAIQEGRSANPTPLLGARVHTTTNWWESFQLPARARCRSSLGAFVRAPDA